MSTTTCETSEDCSPYLICNGDGVCGCFHAQGAVPDEHGMCRIDSTGKATTHFVLTCLAFTGSVLALAYHTRATYLIARLGVIGSIRRFAVFVELATLSYAALCVVRVVRLSDPSLFGVGAMHTSETIAGVLWSPRAARRTRHTLCARGCSPMCSRLQPHEHACNPPPRCVRWQSSRAPVPRLGLSAKGLC